MTELLEVEGLYVDIPLEAGMLHAVRDVGFRVERGQTVCLVGESGCGKSLTALAIMDILPRSARRKSRRLLFEGEDLTRFTERRMTDVRGNKMGMIFHEPMTSLNPCYTIGNQLEEVMLRHRRISRRKARERAVFLLDKVGITAAESRLKQYPHQLSGGLRQRVMIAMSLMCGPSLIVADEPTTALDVTIQAQILALLRSVQQEFTMGMILITHDLGVVARVADRVEVMYCGQVIEEGPTSRIFERPMHPYTQGLIECIPVPGKTAPGEHLGAIPGVVPTPIGEIKGCIYRNRCPHAFADCAIEEIPERTLSKDIGYRCLLDPETCRRNLQGRSAK